MLTFTRYAARRLWSLLSALIISLLQVYCNVCQRYYFENIGCSNRPTKPSCTHKCVHEYVLGEALLRPEWPKFEAEGREREGVLGEGAASPLPTRWSEERCKLRQRGSGRSLDRKCILDTLRGPETRVVAAKSPVNLGFLEGRGGGLLPLVPPGYAPMLARSCCTP